MSWSNFLEEQELRRQLWDSLPRNHCLDEIIFSLEVSFKRTLLNPIKFDKPDGLSSIDVSSFDLVIKS